MGVANNKYSAIYNLPPLAANTWVQFNIPLAASGVSNIAKWQGFWFRASLSRTRLFMWIPFN